MSNRFNPPAKPQPYVSWYPVNGFMILSIFSANLQTSNCDKFKFKYLFTHSKRAIVYDDEDAKPEPVEGISELNIVKYYRDFLVVL